MNEYAHLINDYLCVNPTTFPYTNFLSITFEELDEALHNLQAFERPDMYSVLKDKIIILERKMKLNSKRFCLGDLIPFDFS